MNCDLWFIKNEYFKKYKDQGFMTNKIKSGKTRYRPCFYAIEDINNRNIVWLVPLSSKERKYKNIYKRIIKKYGHCETLVFGTVLGKKAVFLIQNICPVPKKYIIPYLDKNNTPIRINGKISKEVIEKTKYVLKKSRYGVKLTFTNIKELYRNTNIY